MKWAGLGALAVIALFFVVAALVFLVVWAVTLAVGVWYGRGEAEGRPQGPEPPADEDAGTLGPEPPAEP